jgi:hypothetical protein
MTARNVHSRTLLWDGLLTCETVRSVGRIELERSKQLVFERLLFCSQKKLRSNPFQLL